MKMIMQFAGRVNSSTDCGDYHRRGDENDGTLAFTIPAIIITSPNRHLKR